MKSTWLVSSCPCACLCLSIFLIITHTSATIRFDKVEVRSSDHHDDESKSEEVVKMISPRVVVPQIRQRHNQKRAPMNNRPRRDQYATYKVPKQHVLVDYGWTPRQMTSFSSTNLLGPGGSQSPPPSEYNFPGVLGGGGGVSEEDNVVAAGGHGHSQHGGGWGWGHSQGHHHKYKKSDVNSSAVGMLGFLGLLALVQNVLRQMNNNNLPATTLPTIPMIPGMIPGGGGIQIPPGGMRFGAGRDKRSITDSVLEPSSSKLQETTVAIVPFLLRLNQIREREWPLECSSFLVCMLSRAASVGMTGQNEKRLIKATLTSVIGEMLTPLVRPHSKEMADMRKLIGVAANVGLKGDEKCKNHFKECKM